MDKLTDADKLILSMLADLVEQVGELSKRLDVKNRMETTDYQLIKRALFSGQNWAIWAHHNWLKAPSVNEEQVEHVENILEMWDDIESDYEALNETEKKCLHGCIGFDKVVFEGFDGNHELDKIYLSIAQFLVSRPDYWERFKHRSLNSHGMGGMLYYLKMWEVYKKLQKEHFDTSHGEYKRFGVEQLTRILTAPFQANDASPV